MRDYTNQVNGAITGRMDDKKFWDLLALNYHNYTNPVVYAFTQHLQRAIEEAKPIEEIVVEMVDTLATENARVAKRLEEELLHHLPPLVKLTPVPSADVKDETHGSKFGRPLSMGCRIDFDLCQQCGAKVAQDRGACEHAGASIEEVQTNIQNATRLLELQNARMVQFQPLDKIDFHIEIAPDPTPQETPQPVKPLGKPLIEIWNDIQQAKKDSGDGT